MMSPFKQGKYEHTGLHLYYLDPGLSADLESSSPVVLIGSRGSGKTTLLRSLDYGERLHNRSLTNQLENQPFRGWFIGAYTKISQHPCRALESMYGADSPLEGRIFGLYIDALFVSLVARAISSIVSDGILVPSAVYTEDQVSKTCLGNFRDLLQWTGKDEPKTLLEVADVALAVMHRVQQAADMQLNPHDLSSHFRVPSFGEFSRLPLQAIAQFCNHSVLHDPVGGDVILRPPDRLWHFKVCVDEAESVTPKHVRVLNTLSRLAETPLFPVLSFVSQPVDLSSTLIPELTQQKADLKKIYLDETNDDLFRKRAEGVASVRCQSALLDPTIVFSCRTTLGEFNLDSLVEMQLAKSENMNKRTKFVSLAQSFLRLWGRGEADGEILRPLPYIDAYIAKYDSLAPTEPKDHRKLASETFRKKRVVAYLSICLELGRTVPFAFDRMVLATSDHCIRDFLSQLHEILIEGCTEITESSLRGFVTKEVSIANQAKAIRRTSLEKRNSLPFSGVDRPDMTRQIVELFATVTHLLQCKMVEGGNFIIVGGNKNEREDAGRLLRSAAEAGFLRIVDTQSPPDPLQGFRVHTSLAPAYGFSYRGAYYATTVMYDDFARIAKCRGQKDIDILAKQIAEKNLKGETKVNKSLFPLDEDDT